jgi:hypothetical protein
MPTTAPESPNRTLTPLSEGFYEQVLASQYFTQIKTDQPRRNSFKERILGKRSGIFFDPDQPANEGEIQNRDLGTKN